MQLIHRTTQPSPLERRRVREGVALFALFIGLIFLANYFVTHIGTFQSDPPHGPWMIPVWPGIYAPSGVLIAGLTFTCRDLVQRRLGVGAAIVAVLIGAAISYLLDPALALASVSAFLVAEFLDLAVYTPLQRNRLLLAVIASNIVGLIADSLIFLTIAFGSLEFLTGQIIGKAWMTLLVLPLIAAIRAWDTRRGMPVAEGALAL